MITNVIQLKQMQRNFKLSLELQDSAIFYHWNYSPPVKNIGGSFGSVYPDGALFGISFNELRSLGSGTHDMQMDEHNWTSTGTKPELGPDQKQLELLKLVLFGYEHGVFTATECLQHALQSFTQANSNRVIEISPDFLIQSLTEYASRVPKILRDRTPDSFDFFSSAGTTRIPDENLQLVHEKLASQNAG